MTTYLKMLSGLALTAATLVTVSSDAHAGGMRPVHTITIARKPVLVSKVRTFIPARRVTEIRDHRTPVVAAVRNVVRNKIGERRVHVDHRGGRVHVDHRTK